MKALFSEDTSGANHDCLLLMKKKVAGSWGACESYQDYPANLEVKLREHYNRQDSDLDSTATAPVTSQAQAQVQQRLAVKVFWAESDLLIGKKGAAYFDTCFEKYRSGADTTVPVLLYDSEVVPGTDHDTVLFPQYGALPLMIDDIIGAK
jgi:hypothetical protein